jgi:serine/threonine protein kinase
VVLYEMLCGTPPFVAASLSELMHLHCHAAPEPLQRRAPSVPGALAAVVHGALAKRPEARPSSCAELGRALAALG